MVKSSVVAGALSALLAFAGPLGADEGDASLKAPHIHHAPKSVGVAHQPLIVRAAITHPELVRRALLVYRVGDQGALETVVFRRASDGPYVAVIPAKDVRFPSLGYTLELERLDGKRVSAFASRADLYRVEVPEEITDVRERTMLERLSGQRSVARAGAEFVSFGASDAEQIDPASGQIRTTSVQDQYYRVEGAYTYRPLRLVTEFSVRGGVVRGKAPVPVRAPAPGVSEDERFEVGLNYAAPSVRFHVHDSIHLEAELLSSVTEVGFSWGGGGAVLIGDPYGGKLTLGFEAIEVFGNRFYARTDLVAFEGVVIAPIIEVTNMPSADRYGVRLLAEAAANLGDGFSLALRGGYQAREATSGGPSFGATVGYAF